MLKRFSYARMKSSNKVGLLLISPWLIGFLLFKFIPILASLALSFTDFYMLEPGQTQFIGLDNYRQVAENFSLGYLIVATISTIIRTVPLQLGASLFFAALLNNSRLKFSILTRTLFFIPSIIPGVAIVFMWFGFVDPTTGWLNRFILEPLGLLGVDNAFSDLTFTLLFLVSSLWSIGPGILIMLGAMQGVPDEIMEAARVDGAGPMVRFFGITITLLHFFYIWNETRQASLYLAINRSLSPISFGIQNYQSLFPSQNQLQASALIVMAVPVIILLISQRYFMRDVLVTGTER